jgi:hypothetical protein
VLRGFRQFGAPACVIITYDRVLDGSDDTPFDCGAVATARGPATGVVEMKAQQSCRSIAPRQTIAPEKIALRSKSTKYRPDYLLFYDGKPRVGIDAKAPWLKEYGPWPTIHSRSRSQRKRSLPGVELG